MVFYTDVSFSMGLDPQGETDYTDRPSSNLIPGTQIAVGSTISMFYDGLFPSTLQNQLLNLKVGTQFQSAPNLYTYIDQSLRVKSTSQTLSRNTESITFPNHIIIGDSNYSTERLFRNLWRNDYIDNDQGVFDQTIRFNIASKIASELSDTRFSGFDVADNPGQYSEDVHGNIWSLYYSGAQSGNQITDGRVNSSYIGAHLNNIIRRNLSTYVIVSSNEQENTASNLIGIGISTKNNVGYTTDKYLYNDGGFYARRYQGYFLDPDINSGASSGNIETWIRNQANAWPFGNRDSGLNENSNLSVGENAPGVNWFIGGTPVNATTGLGGTPKIVYEGYTGGGTPVTAFSSLYADEQIPKTPSIPNSLNPNEKGGFWGPIFEIDRLRSDINGYTLMIVGYFAPTQSGSFSFNLQSNGASFLWIGCDSGTSGVAGPDGPDGYGPNSKVYSGWTVDNATIQCPASATDRTNILNNTGGAANDVFTNASSSLSFTAGRFYPFRLIVGNPPIGNNGFSADGNLAFSSTNPSFVRLLFDVAPLASGKGSLTYQLNGSGYFFGAKEVWEEGSLFFPPPVTNVTRTIEDELKYRNLRVIGITGYESNDGYDAVFVKNPGEYLYASLSRHNYSFVASNTTPSANQWRFASYFKPIVYGITDSTSGFTRQNNSVTGDSTAGIGASLRISKLNDRYITEVVSGFAGTDYRIGDKFTISNTLLGESSTENNLVINVTDVQPLEYTVTTTVSNNFAERATTPATFTVKKNEFNNNTYTITKVTGGSNYEPGDKLLIPGSSLDGASPANDIIITVSTVLSGGVIDTFSFTGTPTTFISYTVPLNEYFPKNANFAYEISPIDLIFYRQGSNTGIAYTTARITGIAYTTRNITGIAQSSFDITGIAYTNITTPGIAYSTASISGIGYTILSNVGIAFTYGDVTGIAYTTANISGNGVGFTTTSVVSIGYTSPNIVSIGYTAFRISSISYPDAISVESYDPNPGDTTTVNVSLNAFDQYPIGDGGKVILTGTGDPVYDNVEYTFTVADSDTIVLQNTPVTGNPGLTIAPETAKLIITQLSSSDLSGIGTAVLVTNSDHTFVSGDSIIIRGTEIPNWNSTFAVKDILSSTSFSIQNSGTVGLFTGTTIGTGSTVGYNQSELELVVPFTQVTSGITSIAYNLIQSPPDVFNPYLLDNSGIFAQSNNNGITATYQVSLLNAGGGIDLSRYLDIGDVVYIFNTGTVFDYANTGYGLTVTNVLSGVDRFAFEFASQGGNVPYSSSQIPYYIINKLIPIVDAPSHGLSNGQIITISGNQNSIYNNTWQVAQAGINTFRLADAVTGIVSTAADLITTSGNVLNLSGTISRTTTEYNFKVGIGITVFGVTGESAIYNDGYVISGIKSSTNGVPYSFILRQNQTPSRLALPGTSGKIGIHTISGIATVTNTSEFGSIGSVVSIKIQGSPSTFFNNTFTNATILDSSRILLGSNSFRNSTTPNPSEYSSSSNVNNSTITGLVNSNLKVTYGTISPSGYTFGPGASIRILGTTNYNGTYTVNSVNGTTLTLNTLSNSATDFSLRNTSGSIGITTIGPVISFNNTFNFPSPYFGSTGSNIQVKISGTGLSDLNTSTSRNARVVSSNSILLVGNGLDPSSYTNPGAGGTVGLIGANYTVKVTGANSIPAGSSIGIQSVEDQFGNTYIADNLFSVGSNLGDNTNLIVNAQLPLGPADSTTRFGTVGSGGILGLRADAVVTTSGNHPFVEGDTVQIENTTGNAGAFNGITRTIKYVSSTSFILNNTNSIPFTDNFSDANATGGIAGLENYPATVTSTSHPFSTGQSVKIENTTNFNGTYTITKIDDNRFTLGGKINPTSYTELSNSTLNPNSLVTLAGNSGPTITYNGTPRIVGGNAVTLETGNQIRIQNSTTFNGTYTVKKYTNTTFGITFTDPTSFVGVNEGSGSIAGLIGSKARVRSTSHGLIDGQSVKIQNTGTTFDNKVYTITSVDANLFDLNPTVSTATTNFTITSTIGLVGLQNYPAIATFSSIIPSSFAVGSQISIVDVNGTSASATSQQLSLPGPYTIAWRTDGTVTRLGLQEAINPVNYSIVENNAGAGYTAGLRNSPARVRFSSDQFSNLTLNLGLNIGDDISIDISGTDNFNGIYAAKYTDTNTLDLISPSTINPTDYSPNGDVDGVVGLANSNRILRKNTGHGFTNSDVGVTQIYINTGSNTLQGDYGGTYTISEVISTTDIALSGTETPPINYTTTDGEGYYVIDGNGIRVNSTYIFPGPPSQSTYRPHLLDAGDGVRISQLTNSAINGNYSVSQVINSFDLRLNGPYPSPILDAFGRPDYTITDSGFYNAISGSVSGNSNSGASIQIRRNATGVSSSYTINSILSTGSGYKTNELYRIRGSLLGGVDGTNDALLKIGSVGSGGEIQSTNLGFLANSTNSLPDSSLDYESSFSASIILGTGSNAQFKIIKNGKRTLGVTTYSTVQLLSGGSGYSVNEVIRIPGNQLGGVSGDGTSSNLQNDLLIYVENVSSGSITGTGFTFRGTSKDSAPLISSGLSTVYVDGGARRSRPFGLEKVWDNINDGNPPPNQGLLRQTHDMLTLAEANKGGVVKIDRVYTYGDIQKKADIQELFFYSTSTIGARDFGNVSFEASIVYDTQGNSGIATIIFDNDDNDQEIFYNVSPGDTLYFFTSLEENINNGVPFIDYRLTNTGLNVVRAYTDSGSGTSPISGNNFVFSSNNSGFAFGLGLDQIVVQTTNTSATLSDNIVAGYKGIFINGKSVLTVRSDGHPFANGDIVTLRFNRLFDVNPGPPTFIEEGTGIAYTSYRVRNSVVNSFQLEDVNTGNPITPSTIMPDGRRLIDSFADVYVATNNSAQIPYWTDVNQGQLYGATGSGWSLPPHPIIYASQDTEGDNAPVGTGAGDVATLTRALLSIEGEAYTLVPGGKHPIDNRVGLAKAIAKFIADTSKS